MDKAQDMSNPCAGGLLTKSETRVIVKDKFMLMSKYEIIVNQQGKRQNSEQVGKTLQEDINIS